MEGSENAEDPRADSSFETGDAGDADDHVWRHPSEIGAILAAANGIPAPPERTRHPVGAISLGASLVLVAVIIVSLASPGPQPDTLVISERANRVAHVGLSSTTVPSTQAPVRLNGHVGVLRIERWGGGTKAQGNGVMIFDDGYIATSRKLIAGATQLLVTAPGGQQFEAEIVGGDFILDIAVLKIDLPDDSTLSVADIADAEPNPGDLIHLADTWTSPTDGNPVLATDKVVADNNGFHRQELLEFKAAVSDQSAGAPLMDDDGDVVGLLLPIDQAGPNQFALDISAVRLAAHQIIESGFVKHVAWIGIKGASQPRDEGVRVDDVVEGSPADDAGIRVGDVIVTVARFNVSSMEDLHRTLDNLASRQVTEVTLMRGSRTVEVEVTLGIRAQIR